VAELILTVTLNYADGQLITQLSRHISVVL